MATERTRPTLLHELAVAHDERHSYMQRMCSLAGPGAYTIPSTFQRPAPNMLLRAVQREIYGREFSRQKRALTTTTSDAIEETPCQLCLVTTASTHRDRRDQLRKLLGLAPDEVAPKSDSSGSSNSPSRERWASSYLTDIVADFGEQLPVAELPIQEVVRVPQQLCFRAPLSYQHFLTSTSYLDRIKRLQQRK